MKYLSESDPVFLHVKPIHHELKKPILSLILQIYAPVYDYLEYKMASVWTCVYDWGGWVRSNIYQSRNLPIWRCFFMKFITNNCDLSAGSSDFTGSNHHYLELDMDSNPART